MPRRSTPKPPPKDNASLARLFDVDLFPAEGAAIGGSEDIFKTALRIVEHSGITNLIDGWREEDRAREGKVRPGPDPWLSEVQVVTLMLVLTLSRRAPLFTELRDLLVSTPKAVLALAEVDVPRDVSDVALYHRAYNSYRRLLRLMDPEPSSLYRLLTYGDLRARRAARDQMLSALKRERAHDFLNSLLWGTWMLLPRKVRREAKVDLVVDATVVKAPAPLRGTRSEFRSGDPEAGVYKRDGNHDGTSTTRASTQYKRRSDALMWGRELHTGVPFGKNVPPSSCPRPRATPARTWRSTLCASWTL